MRQMHRLRLLFTRGGVNAQASEVVGTPGARVPIAGDYVPGLGSFPSRSRLASAVMRGILIRNP